MAEGRARVAGAIITYQLSGMDSARRTRFSEHILGQDRKVGRKTYRRQGLLDTLPHWKVNRSVIVGRAQDRARVVGALREWTPSVWWSPIPLTRGQLRTIGDSMRDF